MPTQYIYFTFVKGIILFKQHLFSFATTNIIHKYSNHSYSKRTKLIMRNILIITLLLLTQTVLGQKFFDVSFYPADTIWPDVKSMIYDSADNSIIICINNKPNRMDTNGMYFRNLKYDTSGTINTVYTYLPSTHDTLFEVSMLKNIRDTIRCFGNMRVLGVKNYLFAGYFNADMSVHYTNLYQYPINDSNMIYATCMDSLQGAYYLFATRYRNDSGINGSFVTPYVYKLNPFTFDSLKLTQIHGNGNDTQTVGQVNDCFIYNNHFKTIIWRKWDSVNIYNKLPILVPVPYLYDFHTNFAFVISNIKTPWSLNQLNKNNDYESVVAYVTHSNIIKLNSNEYVIPSGIINVYSIQNQDATRNYGILKTSTQDDTLFSHTTYPIYDQHDSNLVSQSLAINKNFIKHDSNHFSTIFYEFNLYANRFLIHVSSLDSQMNLRWQKFIVRANSRGAAFTACTLPNNGIAVAGVEYINAPPYDVKPLIFSLDSTGNLAPSSTSQVSKGTISLTVFPNPAAQQLNFKFDNQIKGTIKIQNLEGKTLQTQAINYPNTNINLHNLPSGVYIYTISSETEIILSNQFIKQ